MGLLSALFGRRKKARKARRRRGQVWIKSRQKWVSKREGKRHHDAGIY